MSKVTLTVETQLNVKRRFLDLISSTTTSFFVPTLDIDLAWQ